jgi:CRP/FNR family transcriptional regulator
MLESKALQQRVRDQFPFLARFPHELLREFVRDAQYLKVDKGQPVCREGTLCSHLALLLSGVARVYKIAENGRDITLYRVEAGQSCILTASCIMSGIPFPAIAECEQAAEAVLLPSPRVREWSSRSEIFRQYLFGLMAQRLGSLIGTVEEVLFRRLDQRLAGYLLQRLDRSGPVINTTHQEIASDLGSSREVVSRLLKDFEGRGLIGTARGSLRIVDPAGLKLYSQSV